jgi:hypothetical protein
MAVYRKQFEVHGNTTDQQRWAANEVKRREAVEPDQIKIMGTRYTGQRCRHGSLVVEVEYWLSDVVAQ